MMLGLHSVKVLKGSNSYHLESFILENQPSQPIWPRLARLARLGRIKVFLLLFSLSFLFFFEEHLLFAPSFLSSCTHIPKTDFGIGLVKIGCYGYEI